MNTAFNTEADDVLEAQPDPLEGLHTTVVIRWQGNPPQYVLHVQTAMDAGNINEFLPTELRRIAKALREEPIAEQHATDSALVDEVLASFEQEV